MGLKGKIGNGWREEGEKRGEEGRGDLREAISLGWWWTEEAEEAEERDLGWGDRVGK